VAIFFFILFSVPAEENESVIVVECQRLDGGTSVFIIPKRKKEKEGGRERERERERERDERERRERDTGIDRDLSVCHPFNHTTAVSSVRAYVYFISWAHG